MLEFRYQDARYLSIVAFQLVFGAWDHFEGYGLVWLRLEDVNMRSCSNKSLQSADWSHETNPTKK